MNKKEAQDLTSDVLVADLLIRMKSLEIENPFSEKE